MTAAELAKKLGYSIFGCPNRKVQGVSFASDARPGDVAIVFHKNEIKKTSADIIVTEPTILFDKSKTFLYSHEPIQLSLIKIAKELISAGICVDYSRQSKPELTPDGFSIGKNVAIGRHTQICTGVSIYDNVTIGDNCYIGSNTVIYGGVYIADNVQIGSNCTIGANAFYRHHEQFQKIFCGVGTVHIETNVNIGNNVIIQRGTLSRTFIGASSCLGNLIDIGHDVTIGKNCFIVSQTGIAGNSTVGNNVTLYGQVGVANNVSIGDNVIVHAQASVTKNIRSDSEISGRYSFNHKDELRCIAEMRRKIKKKENE